MLPRHKKIIENYLLDSEGVNTKYSFILFDDTLNVTLGDDIFLQNKEIDSISTWKIRDNNKEISIIINKINSLDVVSLIAIIDNNQNFAYVTIKQTPTNLYISHHERVLEYDINDCNSDTIINVIQDCFYKKNMVKNNIEIILQIIKTDIDEVFTLMYNNKQNYLNDLEWNLNNIKAEYLVGTKRTKRMIKTINNYKDTN